MGKPSRDKGRRGELEVAKIFQSKGYDIRRVPNSGGLDIKGDLLGLSGFHLEVKRQEKLDLLRWCKQSENESPKGDIPLIIFRRSNDKWRVVLSLEHFIQILGDNDE